MAFIDNYLTICKERGISPTRVLKDSGISHSMLVAWQKGSEPTNRTIKKIADYFNMTVNELEGGQKEKPTTNKSDELARKERFDAVMLLLSDEKREMVEDFAAKLLHIQ